MVTPNFQDDYICSKCAIGYYALFEGSTRTDFYGKAHINDKGNSSSDFTNRYPLISKCVAKDVVEATLVVINETLNNCEILLKDQDATA